MIKELSSEQFQYLKDRGFVIPDYISTSMSPPCISLKGILEEVGQFGITYLSLGMTEYGLIIRDLDIKLITSQDELIKIIENSVLDARGPEKLDIERLLKREEYSLIDKINDPITVYVNDDSWNEVAEELIAKYQ